MNDDNMQNPPAEAVVRRMRMALDLDTDVALADVLGIKPATISSWKGRNSVPLDVLLAFCAERGVSLDWLVWGVEGTSDRGAPSGVASPGAPYLRSSDAGGQRRALAGRSDGDSRSAPGEVGILAMVDWLSACWERASPDERTWMVVQFGKAFPDFSGWLRRNF